MNQRTARDMISDYESGIADIDRKVKLLRSEGGRNPKPDLLKRIYALESMQRDMCWALRMLRPYKK